MLARSLVESGDIEDTVGVDVEGYFDLRRLTRSWSYFELEATDALVVLG